MFLVLVSASSYGLIAASSSSAIETSASVAETALLAVQEAVNLTDLTYYTQAQYP
jgi:hypothetical protein